MSMSVWRGLFLGSPAGTGHRRLDEHPAVVDVAAHGDAQRAVGGAIGLQGHLVAIGGGEHRKVRGLHLTIGIEFNRAAGEDAGPVDQQIVEPHRGLVLDEGERRARRTSCRLDPAGQQAVDLQWREIGFDVEPARLGVTDTARKLERQHAGNRSAEVEAETRTRRLIERRLQPHLGFRFAHDPAVFDLRRSAADLHVALDLVVLIGGGDAQRLRLDPLVEHHASQR